MAGLFGHEVKALKKQQKYFNAHPGIARQAGFKKGAEGWTSSKSGPKISYSKGSGGVIVAEGKKADKADKAQIAKLQRKLQLESKSSESSILGITHIPKIVVDLPIHTFKDALSLPKSIGAGTLKLGEDAINAGPVTLIHDIKTGKSLFDGPAIWQHGYSLKHQLKTAEAPAASQDIINMWKTSVVKKVVEGHEKAALHQFENHPLLTTIDVAGFVDPALKAGDLAKLGKLGDLAKARVFKDVERVPGTKLGTRSALKIGKGTEANKLFEHTPLSKILKAAKSKGSELRVYHEINKTVDAMAHEGDARAGLVVKKLEHEHVKGIKDTDAKLNLKQKHEQRALNRRASDIAANIQHGLVRIHGDSQDVLDSLRNARDEYVNAEHTHEDKNFAKAAKVNAERITSFLDHAEKDGKIDEHVAALRKAANASGDISKELTAEAERAHLLKPGEGDAATAKPYVEAGHMPGVEIATKAVKSAHSIDLKRAVQRVTEEKAMIRKFPHNAAYKDDLAAAQHEVELLKSGRNIHITSFKPGSIVRQEANGGFSHVEPAEVFEHMKQAGHGQPSYLSLHVPREREGEQGFFNGPRGAGPNLEHHMRTAQGAPRGAFNPSALDSQAHTARAIQAAHTYEQFVHNFSVGSEHFDTEKAARTAADEYSERTGIKAEAIPAVKGSKTDYVVVPKRAIDRMNKHTAATQWIQNSGVPKINRVFRNTVLPFSPKWLAGNVVEGLFRSGVAGHDATDVKFFRDRLGEMEKSDDPKVRQAALSIRAATTGLHYGMSDAKEAERLRGGEMFRDKKAVEQFKDDITAKRGVKILVNSYKAVQEGIFAFNRKFESGLAEGAAGRYMREQLHGFTSDWDKTVDMQIQWSQQLAKGVYDKQLALKINERINNTLGKYQGFSPGMRRALNYSPFLPWVMNAVRFTLWTMPKDHPLLTSISTKVANQMKDADTHGFFGMDVARYTPFGFAAPGQDPDVTAAGYAFPQISGAYDALRGQDPYGGDLYGPDTQYGKGGTSVPPGQRASLAVWELVSSFAGPASVIQRIGQTQGRSAYPISTPWNPIYKSGQKPDLLKGLSKALNPAQPVYIPKPSKTKTKSKSSSSSSGALYGGGSSGGGLYGGGSSGGGLYG